MDLPHRIYHGPEVERLYRDLLRANAGIADDDPRLTDARTPTAHATSHQSGGSDAIKLDDLAAPDDNTDLNASTSAHGLMKKLPNDSAQFLNGVGTWTTPGIGGIQTWFPDAPPTSAHADDDEMDSGSIDAQWTENDSSSSVVWDVDTTKHMYRAVQTGNGNVRWSMLRLPVPGSEFVAYCKVHTITEQGVSGVGAGLFVSDDLATNPTTADFRTVELVHGSGTPFRFAVSRTWSAYNGTSSASSSTVVMGHYLRIRCNGTAFKADVSVDGVGWYLVSSVTLGFTPVHYGICFLNVDNAVEATGLWSFFRVQSGAGTSGYNATSIGRYV